MTTTIKGKVYTFKPLDFVSYAGGRKIGFRFDAAIHQFMAAETEADVDKSTAALKEAWDAMVAFAIAGDTAGLEFEGTRLEDMRQFFADFGTAALGTTPKSSAA